MEDIIIGVDLAKRIFQLHGATGSGELLFRKRLTRDQFRDFMPRHPPSVEQRHRRPHICRGRQALDS